MAAFGYHACPTFASAGPFKHPKKPIYSLRCFFAAPSLQIKKSNIEIRKCGFPIAHASSTPSSVVFQNVCKKSVFFAFTVLYSKTQCFIIDGLL